MDMQIGDRVRFLDEIGGGRISGFKGKSIALVEDEDGFEVPMSTNKLVVVEASGKNEAPKQVERASSVVAEKPSMQPTTDNDAAEEQLLQAQKDILTTAQPQIKKIDLPHPVPYHTMRNPEDKDAPIVVDLHAHEVLETTRGMSNGDILRYQLRVMRDTLEQHKNNRGQKIVFIHGKGQGVLRQAVANELRRYYPHLPFQDASFSMYGYGATQVTIR